MKLANVINEARRRSSEGRNLLSNPTSLLRRHGRKLFGRWYRDADFSGKKKLPRLSGFSKFSKKIRHLDNAATPSATNHNLPTALSQVAAAQLIGNTLTTVSTQLLEAENVGIAPTLQSGTTIKGTWWGRYTVGDCQQEETRFRRYTGLQNNGNHPVWIYEYQLLESDFNQRDADQRCHAFKELIDLNLRLGNERDFRINKLQDVVANIDRRCFLITQAVPGAQLLSDYVAQSGAMTALQVRQVLHQGLQTLQYLHSGYRTRWPGNVIERGLYHGNLSLDSLWIRPSQPSSQAPAHGLSQAPAASQGKSSTESSHFFVYFSNFLLWEHLFATANEQACRTHVANGIVELGSIGKDLADLGNVGFQLLVGGADNPLTRRPYDVRNPDDWPASLQHHPLQAFIWRLIGKQPPFNSAGVALSTLRSLPTERDEQQLEEAIEETLPPRTSWHRPALMAVGGGLLAGLGLLPILTLLNGRTSSATVATVCEAPCRLQAMTELPTERIRYGMETGGSWQTAFDRAEAWPAAEGRAKEMAKKTAEPATETPIEIVSNNDGEKKSPQQSAPRREVDAPNWETTLENRVAGAQQAPLSLDLGMESQDDQSLYQAMINGEIDFALMQLDSSTAAQNIPQGFAADIVAYDGIVAVVPYSDATRKHNIAQRLQGEISLQTLREIYTGQRTALDGQPVVPYFPFDPTINSQNGTVRFEQTNAAIAPFTTQLFASLSPEERHLQEMSFQSLKEKRADSVTQAIKADTTSSNNASFTNSLRYDLFARMFRGFEEAVTTTPDNVPIAIGFEQLSAVFGQCSVYPLAISHEQQAVQPFLQSGGKLGHQPLSVNTNLCDDKGGYWPNVEAFHSGEYPLAYPLVVVYPQNSATGKAIGQMLNTAEGQYLLSESGLVPKLPIPTLRNLLWSTPNESSSE